MQRDRETKAAKAKKQGFLFRRYRLPRHDPQVMERFKNKPEITLKKLCMSKINYMIIG